MPYQNVADRFMESVQRCPDRIAAVAGESRLTYAQLNARIDQCARVLLEDLAIEAGDKVAYLLPNSFAILEVFYAIQKIGAVAVPINCRHIAREVAYLVSAGDAKALIYCEKFADKVAEAKEEHGMNVLTCEVTTETGVGGLEATMRGKSSAPVPVFHNPDALSRIQFTGGSTGLPKGAARTHKADLTEIDGVLGSNGMAEHTDEAVVLIQCPLEHHGGHSWFTSAFAIGATLIICGDFHEQDVLEKIQRYKVTHMILLPPVTYLRLCDWPTIDDYDLTSVRLVQSAAGANARKVLEAVFAHFPNAVFNYGWGQSEGGLGTSIRVTREMLNSNVPYLLSIGKPMPGAQLKLVTENGLEVTEPLRHGEALIKSDATMVGYYNQPELTDKVRFDDEWLRTGDLMLFDTDGNYYLCSRTKDVIKSGGENVFAAEVESALTSHPDVQDCMVFGTQDDVMGEGVAAVVVRRSGSQLTGKELQAYVKQTLSSYKKPRYILFVDDLGKDAAGKVRKKEVRRYFEAHKAESVLF